LRGQVGKPYEVTEHSVYANWREAALSHGVRSVLAVPLAAANAFEVGVMVLYASEQDYFARMGTGLFESLGYFTGALLKKQRREEALEHMAYYDSLTGQLNRNGLYLALHAQPQAGYCVMLDIDLFKVVNDTYGHTVGDVVLSHLGTLIDRHTLKRRQLDSNQHLEFYAARWGGEEFFIFLGNATEAQATDWVDHLRLAVAQMEYPLTKEQNIKITASFGIAFCPDSHAMLHTTIEKADLALYQAKAAGRNRAVLYSADLLKWVATKSSAHPSV
jgi:diguanylate cyclase (GGDEF)-like protein